MEEKKVSREEIGRCGRYSLVRFYDDNGKNDFVLQQSRLVSKRDQDGKLVLTDSGTRLEREWVHTSFTIRADRAKEDMSDIQELLIAGLAHIKV